jgi:hypothetical protein
MAGNRIVWQSLVCFFNKEVAMYPRNIRVESPQEALIVEQALAMYREMQQAAATAADGEVLSVAEQLAMTRGRELMRKSLESVLQEEAQASEKKGSRPEDVFAAEFESIAAVKSGRSSRRPAR